MLLVPRGKDYDVVDEAELPYVHVRNLGHGHSGTVEEVRDRNTNKIYARKTIRITGSRANKAEQTTVFRNEVNIIRGLESHCHIISVYATYVTKRDFGILLEPVASQGDLEEFLAEFVREMEDVGTTSPRVLAMTPVLKRGLGCLAAGLAFMHAKRIRHKDIKPRNILVHNGKVMYTDFGYSFDSNGFTRSTTEGRPNYLTRRYSAPEVLEHEQRNSKSDVYSLGCVFIDMLSALTRAIHIDMDKCFSQSMDDLHNQLSCLDITSDIGFLPKVIIHMTEREKSSRQCSIHTAIGVIQRLDFCCSECLKSPTAVWQERVLEDGCFVTHQEQVAVQRSSSGSKKSAHSYNSSSATPSNITSTNNEPSAEIKTSGTSSGNAWIWSTEYQDYYLYSIGQDGRPFYRWAKQRVEGSRAQQSNHSTRDQASYINSPNVAVHIPGGSESNHYVNNASTGDGNFTYMYQSPYPVLGGSLNLGHGEGSVSMPEGRGGRLREAYRPPSNTLNYETVDQSYYVRSKKFFFEGRVFSMIMKETAGGNSATSNSEDVTDYNSSNSIHTVKYENNFVYTNGRRFIVVQRKREFCYACPIFTYSGSATTKRGVRPEEHGIAYSWGDRPLLISGEGGITKPSIAVLMAEGVPSLHVASRIHYGITHPIQYNVKVKEIGHVPTVQIPWFISNWKVEKDGESDQDLEVAHIADILEEDDEDEEFEIKNDT